MKFTKFTGIASQLKMLTRDLNRIREGMDLWYLGWVSVSTMERVNFNKRTVMMNLAIVEKHLMVCFLLSPSVWRTFIENLNFPVCEFCFIFLCSNQPTDSFLRVFLVFKTFLIWLQDRLVGKKLISNPMQVTHRNKDSLFFFLGYVF